VVPDVIANAGGPVSYFEWCRISPAIFWTEEEVNGRLDKIRMMRSAPCGGGGQAPRDAAHRRPSPWPAGAMLEAPAFARPVPLETVSEKTVHIVCRPRRDRRLSSANCAQFDLYQKGCEKAKLNCQASARSRK